MKMQIAGYLDEFYSYTFFLGAVLYFVFLKETWGLYIEVFHLEGH